MEQLRHSVVRVVRTATSDVDRRLNERFIVNLACRLTVDGQTCVARVVDWSDTGAQVRGVSATPIGVHGTLDIEGVGFPLSFIVKRAEDEALHVAFVLDEKDAVRFGGVPARFAARGAA
jgi:methyl-accepting chemotaxis protein